MAMLVALAMIFSYVESLIPINFGVPGMKLGVANLVTVTGLYFLEIPEVLAVSVLDWSHATQGNASADVARTYLLFVLEGKEALAEKYLSLFCKKSDTAKQYVQQWIPIVAASQSLKGKPEERDLLIRWASVCEYE